MRSPARVEDRVAIVGMCTTMLAQVGPGFVPRRAPLPTVDLPSQNLVQNRQYRDTVTCIPAHTEQGFANIAEVRIICATNDDRMMRMTERYTTAVPSTRAN